MLKHGVSRNLIKDYVYSLKIVFFQGKYGNVKENDKKVIIH